MPSFGDLTGLTVSNNTYMLTYKCFSTAHFCSKLQALRPNCLLNIAISCLTDLSNMSKPEFGVLPQNLFPLWSSSTQKKETPSYQFSGQKPCANTYSFLGLKQPHSIYQGILLANPSKYPEFNHFSSPPLLLLLLFKLLPFLLWILAINPYLVSSLLPSLPSPLPLYRLFSTQLPERLPELNHQRYSSMQWPRGSPQGSLSLRPQFCLLPTALLVLHQPPWPAAHFSYHFLCQSELSFQITPWLFPLPLSDLCTNVTFQWSLLEHPIWNCQPYPLPAPPHTHTKSLFFILLFSMALIIISQSLSFTDSFYCWLHLMSL